MPPVSPPTMLQPAPAAQGAARRLRRLTMAYLQPTRAKPQVIQSALNQADNVYSMVRHLILDHQSVTSGLFPRYSQDTDVGYVKDSIYCALACWITSVAYRRLDDERGRQTELRQTAVKTMRGILFSWMQQIDKLEMFKEHNSREHALHGRFDLRTGLALAQRDELDKYGHLQMDLVALFIIALVQMTAGGVQNLVFYIERTYRTPDFGMWARGTRYNVGEPELHASSLGMVKAALEAINGFNVYGAAGTSASVIYVDIDGHNRNRTTFEAILPRESNSKNTDAALLMTIGWPAFATHDPKLFDKTFGKCVRRLEGRYGLRRFLRDGYRTELEDPSRPYYEEHETSTFEGAECQFPAFLAIIALTAQLRGDQEMSDRYWEKLQSLLVHSDTLSSGGHMIVPECYCIDEDYIDAEREAPNTQDFFPISPLDCGHHLISNAIYVVALVLRERLVHSSDLDPIYRHLPASQRPKNPNRNSAFQGSMEGDPVVQVALIAESTRLQMMLSTYGIATQTPHEVDPVQIWPSGRMVKVFEGLGRDKKLPLSGRPPRPFGALNTSKVFRVFGDTVLCYPLLFEVRDFYMSADPSVLIEDIKGEIGFVAKRWKLAGRPMFCIVLREQNVAGQYFEPMLDLLIALKNGAIGGVRVRVGRVHQLLSSGCTEQVDFAHPDSIAFAEDQEILKETEYAIGSRKMSRASIAGVDANQLDETACTEKEFATKADHELYELLREFDIENMRPLAFAVAELWKRKGRDLYVNNDTVYAHMSQLYHIACARRNWWMVRYCAAKLRKTTNSLAPGITNMLVRGKQVTIGVRGCREVTISSPMNPSEIVDLLFSCCPEDEPQMAVFQQELIIACADLITHKPWAFDGVLTIRLGWLASAVDLMFGYVKAQADDACEGSMTNVKASRRASIKAGRTPPTPSTTGIPWGFAKGATLYDLAPTTVKDVVTALLTKKDWHLLSPLQTRRLNGAINRVPTNLYDRVWQILERTKEGIVIAGNFLPQQPTLSDMTQSELTFAYRIDGMMSIIAHPEYRQLMVELLCIIATILERNRELSFPGRLNLDQLIRNAFLIYATDTGIANKDDLTPFYQLEDVGLRGSTATYLVKAVIDALMKGEEVRRKMSMFVGDESTMEQQAREQCSIS